MNASIPLFATCVALQMLLIACSPGNQGDAATKTTAVPTIPTATDLEKLMVEAEAAYNMAVKTGAAWRDTPTIINAAKTAITSNELGKATELAQQAIEQSQMAMQQQRDQKSAGPHLY